MGELYVVRGSSNIGRDDFRAWPVKAFFGKFTASTQAAYLQSKIDRAAIEWWREISKKHFGVGELSVSRYMRNLGLAYLSEDGFDLGVRKFDPNIKPGFYYCEEAGRTLWGASYSVEVVEVEG